MCATIDSFDAGDGETPMARVAGNQIFPVSSDGSSDADDVGDEEDELDNSKMVPAYTYNTISFQKRQALGNSNKFPEFIIMLQISNCKLQFTML